MTYIARKLWAYSIVFRIIKGVPDGSSDKEYACNAEDNPWVRDVDSVLGPGRS